MFDVEIKLPFTFVIMSITPHLRLQLVDYCEQFVQNQIAHIQEAINSAKKASNNEAKSSAGDKHETGKSLMQLEQENNAQHLLNMQSQLRVISLIKNYSPNHTVALGSLVETSNGLYFIALGIGKVEIENCPVFVISPGAPIGKLLLKKKQGASFKLGEKTVVINQIQ